MSSDYDASEFIDGDFQAHKSSSSGASAGAVPAGRAPSREEVDSKVIEAQQRLAELKRAQEELERERAGLEETRRRQTEFQTGRQELIQQLTRGLGLLEEAEFNTRRDAEQMAKSLADLKEALIKIQAIREETWTKDNFQVELTRALTTLENARLEWHSARLKVPALSPADPEAQSTGVAGQPAPVSPLAGASFGELCRVGLALSWPLVLIGLILEGILVALLLRR